MVINTTDAVGVIVVRVKLYGPVEVLDGQLGLAQFVVRPPTVDVGIDIDGVYSNGLVEVLDGPLVLARIAGLNTTGGERSGVVQTSCPAVLEPDD